MHTCYSEICVRELQLDDTGRGESPYLGLEDAKTINPNSCC